MLKKILFTSLFNVVFVYHAFTQGITKDGKYVWANVDKTPDGTGNVLVIQSTFNSWKQEFKDAVIPAFTNDDKKICFINGGQLTIVTLGTNERQTIPEVVSYQQPSLGNGDWIAYQSKSNIGSFIIKNLNSDQKLRLTDVDELTFVNDKAREVLIKRSSRSKNNSQSSLALIDLSTLSEAEMFGEKNVEIINCSNDTSGKRIAFIVQKTSGDIKQNELWYYQKGEPKAELLVNDHSIEIDSNLQISDEKPWFTNNGNHVLFYLQQKPVLNPNPLIPKEDLWSYTDAQVQSIQLNNLQHIRKFAASFGLQKRRLVRLENDQELLIYASNKKNSAQINNEYALIYHFDGEIFTYPSFFSSNIQPNAYSTQEFNWNKATQCEIDRISLSDGSKKNLIHKSRLRSSFPNPFPYVRFFPDGKSIIWYDYYLKNYFVFDIGSGSIRNLTKNIDVDWENLDAGSRPGELDSFHQPKGVLNWDLDGKFLLIPDHNGNVWKLDRNNNSLPLNLTSGLKSDKSLFLTCINSEVNVLIKKNKVLLLEVRKDGESQNDGYYQIDFGPNRQTITLIPYGGKYRYSELQKADNRNLYLIKRETATDPPDWFYTTDFLNFKKVSSERPEQRSSVTVQKTLITYKTYDGSQGWGVLFKPKDFNPNKKYPVIVYSYEFPFVNPNVFETYYRGRISGMIDTGYLFFVPSVRFKSGETGQCAYNYVVSGAENLTKLPYVDGKHMALIGGSFSGFTTNYIITHTHIFAAASINESGVSNLISYVGTEDKDLQGWSYGADAEVHQSRIAVTLWDRPDLYLKNSAVFHADRVTTPYLITDNLDDHRIPFAQSVEMFKALRRLGKRVWLLAGETGGHGEAPGYQAHLKQFFAHYLKGEPPAKWMTRGVPARMKEIDEGMDLDYEIKTPGPGLRMDKEVLTPQQKELLKHRTMVTDDGHIVNVQK